MAAGKLDLTIEQGATFKRTVTWRDDDGNVMSVMGAAVRMQIRESYAATNTVANLSVDSGITKNSDGSFDIAIVATDTAMMKPGSYIYDLEIEDSGTVTRLLAGNVTVSAEVTR